MAVGLSHEINNPLAVIVNQVELLEREVMALAGERDMLGRVRAHRRDPPRGRAHHAASSSGSARWSRREDYATIEYIGPARMIDLREQPRARRDPRLAGLRILVVDDDLGICRSLKEILEAAGCRVETALRRRRGARARGASSASTSCSPTW